MYVKRETVTITTNVDGDATDYTGIVRGRIKSIQYVKTDYADTVDFTITSAITGREILTVTGVTDSALYAPRQDTHTTGGVAATYDGTRKVLDDIFIADEKIKIVVAQGGNTKSGTFRVTVA